MSENNENEKDTSKIVIWIILGILLIVAIFLIFFKGNNNNDNLSTNIYQSTKQTDKVIDDTINIVDANTKELYERVKAGMTINGKLIEVPSSYMKKITDKITTEGYKITDETKTAVNNKLDEIETILKTEGKTDIKELSNESQSKIKNIAKDIEDML